MKKNDIIALVFAAVLLSVAGYIYASQNNLLGSSSSTPTITTVEAPVAILPDIDPSKTVDKISSDSYSTKDYKVPVDSNPIGSNTPFGK